MRAFVIAALCMTACHRDGRYLGNIQPPSSQQLVYANTYEPSSIDPAMVIEVPEVNLSNCIFEGLTVMNPLTTQPMAGMATHYEIGASGKELTFYLRGHPHPMGTRLPDIESLPVEFSHGQHAPADSVPARWSDGSIVTAGDFVYALRRMFDPAIASTQGRSPIIENAAEIAAGKRRPDELGVEAPDDFTLRLRLLVPATYFVLTQAVVTEPVPRRAIEKAQVQGRPDAWVRDANTIGNGPFVLEEWRPYDSIKVRKSLTYYEKDLVRLEKITFLPLPSGAPVMNLYRSGAVQAMYTDSMPRSLVPALETKPDFRREPQYGVLLFYFNLHEPPFDNQMIRWALNMAIDKRALAKYWQTGVSRHYVPAMPGYTPPESLTVAVKGKRYDVMAYNPADARELLALAGYPGGDSKRLTFTINTTSDEQGQQTAEIVRARLETTLNAKIQVNPMEERVLSGGTTTGTLHGVNLFAWTADGADPYGMLGPEIVENYAGWHDRKYFAELAAANSTLDWDLRLRKLADCEAQLMEAMVVVPMSGYPAVYLTKPYVRGLTQDQLGGVWFRYAWIDMGWRP